jgi:hypothetical protein
MPPASLWKAKRYPFYFNEFHIWSSFQGEIRKRVKFDPSILESLLNSTYSVKK